MPVVVRILGPLEVEVDGAAVPMRGAKRRGMLALLAARATAPTALDALCDAIWPGQPLEAARRSAQTYVSQFRRIMPVVASPAGYLLDHRSVTVDAYQFERLTADVVEADVDATSRQLEEALGSWRGPALVEFVDQEWARPLAARWEELRRHAEDLWFGAQRASGFSEEIIPQLEAACAAEPLRESRWEQLILALTDAGRPAEALRAYGRIRDTLRDDMGVSPSPALQDLQLAVLRQEPVSGAGDGSASRSPRAAAWTSSDEPRLAVEAGGQVRALLSSDIEGSTQLLQRLGPNYGRVLERHRQLVRTAIGRHGGVEEGTDGDSFFVTFATAADAVRAAVEMQRALSAESWPGETVLRVRIGIHVGEVTYSEAGITGLAVHHAVRLAATAHGGQVVLTDIAQRLAGDAGEGVRFVGLGEHVVRDMGRILIQQVVAEGLVPSFPALRSASVSRTSVPAPRSSLIGRETEVVDVLALLGDHRLVTLTGAGGCGKTRLAMAVAAGITEVSDVWFVELAELTEESQIVPALAGTLGVPPSVDAVVGLLADRAVLIVLDNCEHVLDATGVVVESLLSRTARAGVMATSREPLGVTGEAIYRVPSLGVPLAGTPLDELVESDAVRLFEERAALMRPGYRVSEADAQAVQSICERLDGIPLALELAAARASVMTPAEIDARLNDRFRLLKSRTRATANRHQTLQATVDWSYRLLTAGEQQQFELLAVFSGGFTLDAAVAVTGNHVDEYEVIDALSSLHHKSLLEVVPSPIGSTFRFPETIRQYAHDRFLAREDVDDVRDRHACHFRDLGARLFHGPPPGQFLRWHSEWTLNVDNVMAAVDWLTPRDRHRAIELLWAIWFIEATVLTDWPGLDQYFERIAEHPDLVGTTESCWARAVAHELRAEDDSALAMIEQALPVITDDTPSVVRVHLQMLRAQLTSVATSTPTSTEVVEELGRLAAAIPSPLFGFTVQEAVTFLLPTAEMRGRARLLIEEERRTFDDLYALICDAILVGRETALGSTDLLVRARAILVRLQREPVLLRWTPGLDIIEAEWGDPQRALAISREYLRVARAGNRKPTTTLGPCLAYAAHVHRIGEAVDTATDLADELLRLHPPEQYNPYLFCALPIVTRSALYRGAQRPDLAAALLARTSLRPGTPFTDAYARVCDEAGVVAHELGDAVRAAQLIATGTAQRRPHGLQRSPWQQRLVEVVPTTDGAAPLDVAQVVAALQSLPECPTRGR